MLPDMQELPAAPFINFTKGSSGKLQLADLLRHGNRSRSNYRCNVHDEALRGHLGRDIPVAAAAADGTECDVPITAVQCLLSLETLWSTLGAQEHECARCCAAHHRSCSDFNLYCSVKFRDNP